tara:strand:+ start:132 stop:971 length:840 start_codon:yes stop_codon:yes gene_type:complete
MKQAENKILFKILFGSLIFISCAADDLYPQLTSALNNNVADATFNHISSVVDTELEYFENQFDINETTFFLTNEHDTCPNITLSFSSDSSYIDSICIDYGEQGMDWKNRTKKGKILVSQNGRRNQIGTITKVEFINFTIDEYSITGTQIIKRSKVEINSGNWIGTDHVQVIEAEIKNTNKADDFVWNSDRIRQGNIENGEFVVCIEGTMDGVNSDGFEYTITTRTPLKYSLYCPRIVSGILNIYDDSEINPQEIDYGDGTCDSKATVSVDNNHFEISLW